MVGQEIQLTAKPPQPRTAGIEIGCLLFRCPATECGIESGIETDLQTFRRIGHLSVRLRCGGCGRRHEFKVADGRLASYRTPPRPDDLHRNQTRAAADAAAEQQMPTGHRRTPVRTFLDVPA